MSLNGRAASLAQIRLFQEIGRRLDAKGFIAANDGNLSQRQGADSFLVTSTGSRKGRLRPEEIVCVDAAGNLLAGGKPPTSESRMHVAIYRLRPDAGAVVHAHPPVATGFAVARLPLDACVLPEVILTLGSVPLAPYGAPGTAELGATLEPFLRGHDAILLANHGAVTLGSDLEQAYDRMERLEHTARIFLVAHLLGRVQSLGRGEVERLLDAGPGRPPQPLPCRPAPAAEPGVDEKPAARPEGPVPARDQLTALILSVLESQGLWKP
jgi:L-fuculose-phosphate aldolase